MRGSMRRSLPGALFHVTTQRHWQEIQRQRLLKQGHGYGWEERQGVFALAWSNWVATGTLHYLSFLTTKLRGRHDGLVVLRIAMTPELIDRTEVALLSSGTATSTLLLAKAREGKFSNVNADQVVLLPSYEDTLVRNTFALREFVREIPTSPDPVEYIIGSDVPIEHVTVVACVSRSEIPANILESGRRLARRIKYRQAAKTPYATGRRPKPLVTRSDKDAFIKCLLKSRRRLMQARKMAC